MVWPRPTIRFLALAFAFSWTLWGVAALQAGTWYGTSALVAGTFGPAVAAVVMLQRQGDWRAVRRALASLVRVRGAVATTVVALALPPSIAAAGWWLDRLLGGSTAIEWPPPWMLPVAILYVLVLGGPLGEELGWRGYLLPRLEQRVSSVVATLAVGAAWAVWHLPLFFVEATVQTTVPMGLFAAQIMITSFFYTWLVHRSPGSLVPALAFHTSFNISVGTVLLHPSEAPAARPLLLALAVAAVVAAVLSATATFRLPPPDWSTRTAPRPTRSGAHGPRISQQSVSCSPCHSDRTLCTLPRAAWPLAAHTARGRGPVGSDPGLVTEWQSELEAPHQPLPSCTIALVSRGDRRETDAVDVDDGP